MEQFLAVDSPITELDAITTNPARDTAWIMDAKTPGTWNQLQADLFQLLSPRLLIERMPDSEEKRANPFEYHGLEKSTQVQPNRSWAGKERPCATQSVPPISQTHLDEFYRTSPADMNGVILAEHHQISNPGYKSDTNTTDCMNMFSHLFDDTLISSPTPIPIHPKCPERKRVSIRRRKKHAQSLATYSLPSWKSPTYSENTWN